MVPNFKELKFYCFSRLKQMKTFYCILGSYVLVNEISKFQSMKYLSLKI